MVSIRDPRSEGRGPLGRDGKRANLRCHDVPPFLWNWRGQKVRKEEINGQAIRRNTGRRPPAVNGVPGNAKGIGNSGEGPAYGLELSEDSLRLVHTVSISRLLTFHQVFIWRFSWAGQGALVSVLSSEQGLELVDT